MASRLEAIFERMNVSLAVLALIAALIVWALMAQRDLRCEIQEIYANVFVRSIHWWDEAVARIASVRFGIRHLLALTTTIAITLAITRWLGCWAVVLIPTLSLFGYRLWQRWSAW